MTIFFMNSQPFSGQDKMIKTSNVGGFYYL